MARAAHDLAAVGSTFDILTALKSSTTLTRIRARRATLWPTNRRYASKSCAVRWSASGVRRSSSRAITRRRACQARSTSAHIPTSSSAQTVPCSTGAVSRFDETASDSRRDRDPAVLRRYAERPERRHRSAAGSRRKDGGSTAHDRGAGNPVNLTIEHAKQTGTLSELVYREITRETA